MFYLFVIKSKYDNIYLFKFNIFFYSTFSVIYNTLQPGNNILFIMNGQFSIKVVLKQNWRKTNKK